VERKEFFQIRGEVHGLLVGSRTGAVPA